MAGANISQFRVGESNYNYIVYDPNTLKGIVVDPLDAAPVLEKVKEIGLTIPYILNTHEHCDHIAGNEGVKKATGAKIYAGANADITGVDAILSEGQTLDLDGIRMKTYNTPGHTKGHISLVVNDEYILVGDTLFLGGCGNCKFGGDPEVLFETVQRLKTFPDHLKILYGHEYALKNLEFCETYDPGNPHIAEIRKYVEKQLQAGEPPVTTLAMEKQYNVFLRSDEDNVYQTLKKNDASLNQDSKSVFIKLRELRNTF